MSAYHGDRQFWILAIPLLAGVLLILIASIFGPSPKGVSGTVLSIVNASHAESSVGGFVYNGTGYVSGGGGVRPRIEMVVQLNTGYKVSVICESGFLHTQYEYCLPLTKGDSITVYLSSGGWGLTP